MAPNLTIRRAADGSLYVRPYLGANPITGKDMKPYRKLRATTMADAEVEAREWYASIMGNPLLPSALEGYVDTLEDARRPANTIKTYRMYISYLRPLVARVRVRDLTVRNLTDVYRELLKVGSMRGGELSGNTVLGVHWFLRSAYNWFVGQGIATVNPALMATKPTRDELEVRPLEDADLSRLKALLADAMADASTERAAAERRVVAFAAYVALYTGMRCGEVCGLWRADVKSFQSYVHVGGTVVEARGRPEYQPKPKGKRSRNITLNADELRAIRRHVLWQDTLFSPRALDVPLVSLDGCYMRPSKVAQRFAAMAAAAGLPEGTHFHTLRHTHATWLLASGADVKTVSERMGHASPSTTLAIYAHVLPGRDQEAARMFHDAMEGI